MAQQPPPASEMNAAEGTDKSDSEVCDVLCSLGNGGGNNGCGDATEIQPTPQSSVAAAAAAAKPKTTATRTCPKQHQLPMFLSKTYHMIDRCDPEIATWSLAGDNFVVKHVEQFASNVLPLYFKHSNFSSFARQLNFYGFRKLRSDPILTSDVDPRTACYVRFYHDKFQKDRPELLHQIKRATKSDMQSKDDVESLKLEVNKLNECITNMSSTMDRKLAEMSYEYNRRITSLTAEYDKLAVLVTQILANQQHQQQQHGSNNPAAAVQAAQPPPGTVQLPNPHPPSGAPPRQQPHHAAAQPPIPGAIGSSLMHSLSQVAAISLQNHHLQPPQITVAPTTTTTTNNSITNNEAGGGAANNNKRSASEDVSGRSPQKQKSS